MRRNKPRLTTVRWRENIVGKPENELVGVMYEATQDKPYQDWVINKPDHWLFTGLRVQQGQAVKGLVGYEFDRVFDNGRSPRNLEIIAESPIKFKNGRQSVSHTTLYKADSGACVFASGTMWWGFGLADLEKRPDVPPSPLIQSVTRNLLNQFLVKPKAP